MLNQLQNILRMHRTVNRMFILNKQISHNNASPLFQDQGFEVFPNFLSEIELETLKTSILNSIKNLDLEKFKRISKDKFGEYDVNFFDIDLMKVEFGGKSEFLQKIKHKISLTTGCKKTKFDAINLYRTDTLENPRCYHVDSYSYHYIKGFIYFKDIEIEDGPFSYLAKTHRSILFRTLNLFLNILFKHNPMDFRFFQFIFKKHIFTEKKGTLIISNQLGAHAGTPQQKGRAREMLSIGFKNEKLEL